MLEATPEIGEGPSPEVEAVDPATAALLDVSDGGATVDTMEEATGVIDVFGVATLDVSSAEVAAGAVYMVVMLEGGLLSAEDEVTEFAVVEGDGKPKSVAVATITTPPSFVQLKVTGTATSSGCDAP